MYIGIYSHDIIVQHTASKTDRVSKPTATVVSTSISTSSPIKQLYIISRIIYFYATHVLIQYDYTHNRPFSLCSLAA